MSLALKGAALLGIAIATVNCTVPPSQTVETSFQNKIGFDLNQFDENGLYGPEDGKRSLDYEFCLPANNATYANQVLSIDPTLDFYERSPGRIGCDETQELVIGNTGQPNFREVLMTLAALDYIERIEPVYWE